MIVLVINCGSSSVKYCVMDMEDGSELAAGIADRVAVDDGQGAILEQEPANGPEYTFQHAMGDHRAAMGYVLDAITHREHGVIDDIDDIEAVGHRVVHGGEQFEESVIIDADVIASVENCVRFAPLHNPANLAGIHACRERLPNIPHVAVFDTEFHHTMPRRAYLYGLPYEHYQKLGVRRYGFHGTSHRYVSMTAADWLTENAGIAGERQRIVTCHLGNGCSMAAVNGGESIDTSMGLTPLEGLVMGTRCGDIDPAIVPYLEKKLDISSEGVENMLNHDSGLLGISGISSDMRDVTAAAFADDEPGERAMAAIEVFTYRIRKYIGSYAAALGGIDAAVFTAGIGENEPPIRSRAVENLEFLGLKIDNDKNHNVDTEAEVTDISADSARASVLIIPTDEELMIAMDTKQLVSGG